MNTVSPFFYTTDNTALLLTPKSLSLSMFHVMSKCVTCKLIHLSLILPFIMAHMIKQCPPLQRRLPLWPWSTMIYRVLHISATLYAAPVVHVANTISATYDILQQALSKEQWRRRNMASGSKWIVVWYKRRPLSSKANHDGAACKRHSLLLHGRRGGLGNACCLLKQSTTVFPFHSFLCNV